MSDDTLIDGFGAVEKDAIGEIMNITMGSAATAVSNMLSAKVWITTPTVSIAKAKELSFPELEPAILVRIRYTHGVSGQNVLVLKQNDVQLILNQLMGMPLEVTDDFEFDEMNISAVCEVMNQMMGSSATALSEIIDTAVDISTPEAIVQDSHSAPISKMYEDDPEDNVCVVKFNLTIDGVINSEFMSVLTIEIAKEMAKKMLDGYNSDLNTAVESSAAEVKQEKPAKTPVSAPASSGAALSQDQINAMLGMGTSQQPVPQQNTAPVYQAPPPQYAPQQPYPDPAIYGMPAGGYPGYPPQQPYPQQAPQYGYPQQQQVQRGINVQAVQVQNFETYPTAS